MPFARAALRHLLSEQFLCPPGFRKCNKSGQCVAEEFWCDWTRDCIDGSDETDECREYAKSV